MKSLLRRWSIAKQLYQSHLGTSNISQVMREETTKQQLNKISEDVPLEELEDSLLNNNGKTQPECTDEESIQQKTVDGDVSEIEDMFSEAQGYVIPDGEEGERIRQLSAAIILRKIRNATRKETIEKIEVNSISLSEIGRDLSELLIMDGQERFAMSILLECAALDGLEPTTGNLRYLLFDLCARL